MNCVCLIGRLLTDPVCKDKYVKATIAINEAVPVYVRCVAFDKQADVLKKFFKKGNRISIEGNLKNNKFEKLQDMQLEVIIRKISFIDKKDEVVEDNESVSYSTSQQDVIDTFGW